MKTVQIIMGDNDSTMILRAYANRNQEDVTNGCNTFNDNMDYTLQQCNVWLRIKRTGVLVPSSAPIIELCM